MRHALLIGSQTFGLKGVHHDLKLMHQALELHGFSTRICKDRDASRAGIFQAWRDLIATAQEDDAVVLYYAGHGARAVHPEWHPGAHIPRFLPFIVPTDFDESSETDFRGILDLEMAELLAALTQKCPNVAVLLDCCHSSRLVRSARGRARAFGKNWQTGIPKHLAQLKKAFPNGLIHRDGNPFAVRLAAAGPHQSAFEDPDENLGGFFTEVLAEALSQAVDTPVPWAQLGAWVREQVLIMEPRQRPEIEGPANRLIFSCHSLRESQKRGQTTSSTSRGFTFFYDGADADQPSIRGGHLHAVAPGNRYAVFDLHNPKQRIATAEVSLVQGAVSRVTLKGEMPRDGSPIQALRELFPKMSVQLDPATPAPLRKAVAQSSLIHPFQEGQSKPMAKLTKMAKGFLILDEANLPMQTPTQQTSTLLRCLENMARAHLLRELREEGQQMTPESFQIDWGRVCQSGQPELLDPTGAELHVGDRVFVRLTNLGPNDLYVNLFDIGIRRNITLLNHASLSGYHLHPKESWCFGHRALRGLEGIPLSWSAEIPPTAPRLETLVAVISDHPMNLTSLCGNSQSLHRSHGSSGLEQMIDARCRGGHRSHASDSDLGTAYAVRQIHFELFPEPRTSMVT